MKRKHGSFGRIAAVILCAVLALSCLLMSGCSAIKKVGDVVENAVVEQKKESGDKKDDKKDKKDDKKDAGESGGKEAGKEKEESGGDADTLDPDGTYTSKEDVALYIHTYGKLPSNFITKKEAKKLGWESGSLEKYAPGCCIGGDRFGNYEGRLPEGNYTECDIDTLGADKRGAKRIVFSDDGAIYYTEDHYETFELLYEAE